MTPWARSSGLQQAAEGDGGAAPEFAGPAVPDDVRGVVVAVQADRPAQRGVVLGVPGGADQPARRAGRRLRSRRIRQGATFPVRRFTLPGVDGPEGGRGEGGEHGRMGGDGGGDAFAAGEAGADELVGVGAVGLRAGWADAGAAVAAGHVEHPVGHVGDGVAGVEDAAGGLLDGVQLPGEPDGADAAAGVGGVGEPAVVVRVSRPGAAAGHGGPRPTGARARRRGGVGVAERELPGGGGRTGGGRAGGVGVEVMGGYQGTAGNWRPK